MAELLNLVVALIGLLLMGIIIDLGQWYYFLRVTQRLK